MVVDTTSFKLISWTIPSPRGLWYRGIVLTPKGLFITPELDVVSMDSIAAAIEQGPEEVLPILTGHGRFKRCEFIKLTALQSVSVNTNTGTIHMTTEDSDTSVRVPDRALQAKIAAALGEYVRQVRAETQTN